MQHPQPLFISPQDGQTISLAGDTYRLVMTGAQTGGDFAVIEMLVPPGGGPGPHSHAGFHETFHVLEGEIELQSEAGQAIARAGDFVEIPKGGVVHGFKNKSENWRGCGASWCPPGWTSSFWKSENPSRSASSCPHQKWKRTR